MAKDQLNERPYLKHRRAGINFYSYGIIWLFIPPSKICRRKYLPIRFLCEESGP